MIKKALKILTDYSYEVGVVGVFVAALGFGLLLADKGWGTIPFGIGIVLALAGMHANR